MKALSLLGIGFVLALLVGCDTTEPGPTVLEESYKHIRATWSPDGGSVAFTATINGVLGIYAVDTSGANLRLIHAGDALGLSWSPNGQYIAYSEQTQIHRVSVTQDVPELIVAQAPSIRPNWSPDGTSLVYVRNGLRMVRVATGEDVALYQYGTSPSWRPDGKSVVDFTTRLDAATGGISYSVYLIDIDSLTRSDIYTNVSYDDCAFYSLSPDGLTIVYGKKPDGERSQIRRIMVGSRTEIGLTTDGGDFPSISSNGEWIVYTRTAPGDGGLWLMRMDGSEKRRLTTP